MRSACVLHFLSLVLFFSFLLEHSTAHPLRSESPPSQHAVSVFGVDVCFRLLSRVLWRPLALVPCLPARLPSATLSGDAAPRRSHKARSRRPPNRSAKGTSQTAIFTHSRPRVWQRTEHIQRTALGVAHEHLACFSGGHRILMTEMASQRGKAPCHRRRHGKTFSHWWTLDSSIKLFHCAKYRQVALKSTLRLFGMDRRKRDLKA